MITRTVFGTYQGREVGLYTLTGEGLCVGVTDFGATVQFIRVGAAGSQTDVALGYATVEQNLASGTYCGATVGRVANRIRGARFELGGRQYRLAANDGNNHLHGGEVGFDKRFFDAEIAGGVLRLSLLSKDGDQNYPGNLALTVEFEVVGKTLEIRYTATSDCDTLFSPTCHAYFNLDGESGGDITSTKFQINADCYTPSDGETVPTGEICPVQGTPYDFRELKTPDADKMKAGGYDDNYVLNGFHAACAVGAASGIRLDVYTDLPGLQFYTGKYIKGRGRTGEYAPFDGFCMEPQYFPDAVNVEGFETPLLRAGEKASHIIKYVFTEGAKG